MSKHVLLPLLFCVLLGACSSSEQELETRQGHIETITVHAESLGNNLIGETLEREVLVYLPPSYRHDLSKRYPVVYVLHGWGGNAAAWFSSEGGNPDAQNGLESLLDEAAAQEMILVVPDVSTRHLSSWFQNSPVTGNWEDYLTGELIGEIDGRYRTLAQPSSRGLAGHSSGGFGVLLLALTHPELYGAAYAMAPGSLEPMSSAAELKEFYQEVVEPQLAGYTGQDSQIDNNAHYFLSVAQLFMPDPDNAPTYIAEELTEEGLQAMATFNVHDFITSIQDRFSQDAYRELALQVDVGTQEGRTEQFERLVERLTAAGLRVELHLFDAGHTDKVNESMLEVLGFMSDNLDTG